MKRVAALTAVLSMTLPTAQILAQNATARGGSGGIQNVKPSVDWSRISKLPPGTVIIIGWPASTFAKLDLLSVTDDELIGLDLSGSALPAPAARQLRKAASVHADYFLHPPPGTILVFDNEFYLKASDIFLDGQKVADLHQILRRIPRADVERDATTFTILPAPRGMSLAAKTLIGIAAAIAAFGIIISRLVPET